MGCGLSRDSFHRKCRANVWPRVENEAPIRRPGWIDRVLPDKKSRRATIGLTGHLCPFSGCGELARFPEDFGEAVGEAVEATARMSIGKGSQYALDWKLRKRHIPNAETKNGEALRVPLNSAIAALKALVEAGDRKGRVFRIEENWRSA